MTCGQASKLFKFMISITQEELRYVKHLVSLIVLGLYVRAIDPEVLPEKSMLVTSTRFYWQSNYI